MKKIPVIVILVLISLFSCTSFFIYQGYLKSHKSDIRAFIASNKMTLSLESIVIDSSQLFVNNELMVWQDENKELRYKNMLYDVVRIERTHKKIILFVLSDNVEKKMVANFGESFSDCQSESTNTCIKLLKQFFGLKYLASLTLTNSSKELCFNEHNTHYILKLKSIVLLRDILPPEIGLAS